MFQLQHLGRHLFRGISGREVDGFLQQDGALVVLFIHEVDGHPAFGFAVAHHSLMHMVAVHAFTPVSRQQGGVNINDALGVVLHQVFGQFPEKAGQHQQLGTVEVQRIQQDGRIEPFAVQQQYIDAVFARQGKNTGLGVIGYNEGKLHIRPTAKMLQNGPGIAALSGGE